MSASGGSVEIVCPRTDGFTLGRIPFKAAFESPQLLGPIWGVLRPCPIGSGENLFHLRMRYGSEPSRWKDGLRAFWSGTLRSGVAMEYYASPGQRVVYVPGRAWGRLDFGQQVLEIVCGPGQEACAYEGCLVPLLCEFFAWHGHFVIHAASLSFEQRGERIGVLLAGISGAGKTTTALALARTGMMLLSDDMSLVESTGSEGSKVGLWGLQLPCKVHDHTRRLLPWLNACPAASAKTHGEIRMDVTPAIGQSTGTVVDPRLILLLAPRSEGGHVIERLDKTQAMIQLSGENIRVYEHHAEGTPGRAFRAVGQLVAQCDVYRLRVGEPLSRLAEQIRDLSECSR